MANYSNNVTTNTTTVLAAATCLFQNLSSGHLECITNSADQATHCVSCPIGATFSTGEGLNDVYSKGHVISLGINSFTATVGLWGFLSSCLILDVLRRQKGGGSFDILLGALAWYDKFVCFSSVIMAICFSSWLQNWTRSQAPFVGFHVGYIGLSSAKSGSDLTTIVIALERFVAINLPFRARAWFTPFKTRVLVGILSVYTCLYGLVCLLSVYTGSNRVDPEINSTAGLNYLMYSSPIFQPLVLPFEIVEIFVPIPVLLILNGMTFYSIRKASARRQELSCSERKELHAGRMIMPVVVLLLFCSITPIVEGFALRGQFYTEMLMITFSLYALNSAANFPIYYWKSESFRQGAKTVLGSWFPCWRRATAAATTKSAASITTIGTTVTTES